MLPHYISYTKPTYLYELQSNVNMLYCCLLSVFVFVFLVEGLFFKRGVNQINLNIYPEHHTTRLFKSLLTTITQNENLNNKTMWHFEKIKRYKPFQVGPVVALKLWKLYYGPATSWRNKFYTKQHFYISSTVILVLVVVVL